MKHTFIKLLIVTLAIAASNVVYAQLPVITPPFPLDTVPNLDTFYGPRSITPVYIYGNRDENGITLYSESSATCTITAQLADGTVIAQETASLKSGYTLFISPEIDNVIITIKLLGKNYTAIF